MTSRPLEVSGLTHGENKKVNELAKGMGDAQTPPGGGGQLQEPDPQPVARPNVFGPSQGDAVPEPILPQDGLGVLRALYRKFPNEDLRRLLERAAENVRVR